MTSGAVGRLRAEVLIRDCLPVPPPPTAAFDDDGCRPLNHVENGFAETVLATVFELSEPLFVGHVCHCDGDLCVVVDGSISTRLTQLLTKARLAHQRILFSAGISMSCELKIKFKGRSIY